LQSAAERGPVLAPPKKRPVRDEIDTLDHAEEHEVPVSAVPEAARRHHEPVGKPVAV